MAFCVIEPAHVEALTKLVFHKIRKNPASLKNFKQFSKEVFDYLTAKGQSVERAVTLTKFLPQTVSEFNANPDDRKLLRGAAVSMDAIYDVEDQFKDYSTLSKYLGLKNEVKPLVVVNEGQLLQEAKIENLMSANKVEFVGDVRVINGKRFGTRVTDIAKVGFNDKDGIEENPQTPALKHGNTVDTITKALFDNIEPVYKDFSELIDPQAFDTLVAKVKQVKAGLEQLGYVFRTGVTVFDKTLGISGEIDLVAITPDGKAFIMDFKTAKQRFNETYLKNDTLTYRSDEVSHDVPILSKWKQYGTQGYLYGKLLENQTGIAPITKVGIIGINIGYDTSVPVTESKITQVNDIEIHNIPYSDVRTEFKNKTIEEIHQEFLRLTKESETSSPEIVTLKKPLSKNRKKRDLDRIAIPEEIPASEKDFWDEVKWLTRNPVSRGTLIHISGLVNTGLFGNFKLDGITLYKNASRGTAYHEGWHRFSQVFMTQQEKTELYKSIQDDAIVFRTRDGRRLNSSKAEFIDIEEFLADEFAKFALNPEKYKYPRENEKPKNLFQRIWEFLQRYFGPNPRPIELFQKLYDGKIAEYTPSVNNAFWGNLNSLALNNQGEEIVSNERLPVYIGMMDHLVGKEVNDAGKSFTAFKQSKALQSRVLDNVFAALEEIYNNPNLTQQQSNELHSILENERDFTRVYLAATSYDSLKDFTISEEVFNMSTQELAALDDLRDQYEDSEDYDDTADLDSKPERFDRAGNEDSAYSVADHAIQDFFRTVPKIKSVTYDAQGNPTNFTYEVNEFGIPQNHKYYDVFYKAKKMLSGSFNMDDMLAKMTNKNNQRIFPELSIINNFIQKFVQVSGEQNFYRNVQNTQFVQAFYNVMVMPEVNNMQLTQNFLPLSRQYSTFKPTMVSYRTASRTLVLKIIKTWEKNFKDRRGKKYIDGKLWADQKQNFVNTPLYLSVDNKILLNPFMDYSKYPSTLQGVRDFWNAMGANFNPKVFEDPSSVKQLTQIKNALTSNISTYRDFVLNELNSDLASLTEYLMDTDTAGIEEVAQVYFIGNPITFFNEKRQYTIRNNKGVKISVPTEGMRYLYEDLAAVEEKFGDRVSSGSFRIEDKTKYPYYIPNQLLQTTEMMNMLDATTEFADNLYLSNLDPIKNPWIKRSLFMKRMFDQNGVRSRDAEGNRIRVIVEDIASIRTMTEDGQGVISVVEKSPRSLTTDEKFFMDVLTMFSAGAIEIPRAETSSTMFVIRLSDYGKGKNMPITIQDTVGKGDTMPENFHAIVKDYFAAEIEKRQWFKKNDPAVRGANKKALADQFNVFEGILSQDLRDKVVQKMDEGSDANSILNDTAINGQFRKEIEDYFNKQIAEIRPRFDGQGKGLSEDQKTMLRDTLSSPNLRSFGAVAKAFILNHFILSQEFYQLYFGDLYFYKNSFKRGKYVTNTGNTFFIDNLRNNLLNRIQNSTLNSIFTGKKAGGRDFRYVNTSIMNDVEMQSSYVSNNDSNNILLNDALNMRVASGTLAPNSPEYVLAKNDIKASLEKYNLINIADGQGIIGLDFYRNFSIITNIWTEEKEREYERQKAIFRKHFDLYFELDQAGNKIRLTGDRLKEAQEEDDRMIKNKPFHYFNPLKISYTGPQVEDGPTRPVFDKFSVRPIIPEAAIGKRDESLLLRMAEGDIDYVKFKSGSKVYQDSTFDWFKKVSEGKYDLNDFSTEEIDPNQLYAGYLKHQLSTEKFNSENIFGSQFRNIVFGVKYSPLVRDNNNLVNYFTNLEKRFKQTVDDLIKVEQNDLFSLLGVTETNGKYRVSDMKKFIKLLQEESVKRGVPINNINYIQYDEMTKTAKYPIDYAFDRQSIQDLLSGLIDERLRRLKLSGSSLIQVSSAGSESKSRKFTNATRADIEKYGTTGLHYYHIEYDGNGNAVRTSTMGVKVAMSKDYEGLFNLDAPPSLGTSEVYRKYENEVIDKIRDEKGNPIAVAGKIRTVGMSEFDALKRLNQALQDPEWRELHKDKLRLIGYRIPTQDINFTDNMDIMEFLPRSAGAIIIPPIELIIKSGSDFDIDKMNVIRPVIDKDGRIVEAPKESLEEIAQAIANHTFGERDIKKARNQLKEILTDTGVEIDALEALQFKVRMTMIDLAMKAGVDTSIIDKIMTRVKDGEAVVIPDGQALFDDVHFTEQEVADAKFTLDSVTADYQRLDTEIERLRAQYKGVAREKGAKDEQMEWFNKKKNYRNAKNNDLINILQETMSHPYYFELLITPSSASMFEGYTNELIASQAKMTPEQYQIALAESDNKLYDRTTTAQQASTYLANLEAFSNSVASKNVGGPAIQRTFADKFNFAKFSIAKSYTVKSGKNYVDKVIHTPLIAPADRSKSLVNGRILMHGDSVTGIPTSKSYSELITLILDLFNVPAYPYTGFNKHNSKQTYYLLHQKTDPKMVMWFMNQPILKTLYSLFEEKRRKVAGYTIKHAIVELALKNKILENPPLYATGSKKKYEVYETKVVKTPIDPSDPYSEVEITRTENRNKANGYLSRPYIDLHNQNLTDADFFDFNLMDRAIRGEEGPEIKALQNKVLAYFASIIEESDLLMKLQFAENVDTTKYSTLTSIIRNENNRTEVRNSELFDEGQLNAIENDSMIAPFDYTQKAKSILKTLFPKLYTTNTISTFSNIIRNVFGAKNVQIERISKIVENDFIEFIYKNYGTYNGENLSDRFEKLLMNTDNAADHEYFADKLNSLKAEFPELQEIPFVSALYEDVYYPPDKPLDTTYRGMENMEVRNIFFLRNPDNPVFERNVFTNNWRNLINFDPQKLGLEQSYTEEQTRRLSDFFHELMYFSLYQAGLTNTGNGFSDLIPYEHWAHFIEQAFNAYDVAKEKNENLEEELLEVFSSRFKQMNPKINWSSTKIEIDVADLTNAQIEKWEISEEEIQYALEFRDGKILLPLDFYKNYYRGKDYKVSDDELGFVRDLVLKTKEVEMKPQATYEPGRYVEYKGDVYIITKPLNRPGIWQIYNPTKDGAAAKLSVSEKNITAMKEKGSIVTYGLKQYLVTAKEVIIDLDNNRKVNWSSKNIARVKILEMAKEQVKPQDGEVGPSDQPQIDRPC